jgi:lipopolysaccharide heptosyltransferase I
MHPPRSILIIKPGSMGDVIHALPVASALHSAWPEAQITWIVDPRWRAILEGNPAIHRIHDFPRQEFRGGAGWIRALRWYSDLRGLKADLVIDLQGLLRSGLMGRFTGSGDIVGLSDAREGARYLYSRIVRINSDQHAVERYFSFLAALGIDDRGEKRFPIRTKKNDVKNFSAGRYIVFHPFSRGSGKELSGDATREIIAVFANKANCKIVLVGNGAVEGDVEGMVENLAGRTTLSELIEVVAGAEFVVSTDSGPMHLAAALGVPVLGIHTWSDPRRVGPYGRETWIWQGGVIRRQDLAKEPLPVREFGLGDAQAVGEFAAAQVGGVGEAGPVSEG